MVLIFGDVSFYGAGRMANSADPRQTTLFSLFFLAYQIRTSQVFAWDKNSYLPHIISPKKENFHVNLVCIGCIEHLSTLSLGLRHCDITMSNLKMSYVKVIVCGNECF